MLNNQKWMSHWHEPRQQISCTWTGHNSIGEGCFNATTSPWSMGTMLLGGIGGVAVGGPLGMLGGIVGEVAIACIGGAVNAAFNYCAEG